MDSDAWSEDIIPAEPICSHTYLDLLPVEILKDIAGFNVPRHSVYLNREGYAVFSINGVEYAKLRLIIVQNGKIKDTDNIWRSSDKQVAEFVDRLKTPASDISSRIALTGTAVSIIYKKSEKKDELDQIRFMSAHSMFTFVADDHGRRQVADLLTSVLQFRHNTPKAVKRKHHRSSVSLRSEPEIFDWDAWFSDHISKPILILD